MSLGWRYCTKCLKYQKWQEAPPNDFLECDHDPNWDTDVIDHIAFDNDDEYYKTIRYYSYMNCAFCLGTGSTGRIHRGWRCEMCLETGLEPIPLAEFYERPS